MRNWNAIRRGAVYCAPACGGGCTWAEYQDATRNAEKLVKALGPGWKTDVWENLGWHWAATKGVARVTPDIHRRLHRRPRILSFTVFFNTAAGQIVVEGKTPLLAIAALVGAIDDKFKALTKDAKKVFNAAPSKAPPTLGREHRARPSNKLAHRGSAVRLRLS